MSLIATDDVNRYMAETFGVTSHRCIEVGDGWAVARYDVSDGALRPGAIISGPAVFGLVDAAISFAAWTRLGIEPMLLTSELSIRYARPARGSVLYTRGVVHSVSRRTVIGSAFAWTDDESKPVAIAQGSFARPAT
jgi:acyl-coenzyme A thioesterase PaaI-like protein